MKRRIEPCALCLKGCSTRTRAKMLCGAPQRWKPLTILIGTKRVPSRLGGSYQKLWCLRCDATGRRHAQDRNPRIPLIVHT